ncbi:hypothetical protein ACFP81_04665 [Deinococcus lacus]|uniref:EF-hand domain-containing protein n=1 Tax=Deinococcus lacus TaxID=392561 RepID=A0ABW1YB44_9DEIO
MFFDQKDLHEKMARIDPRDTNGDGVVTAQETAAYIQEYLKNASPEERDALLKDYMGGLSDEDRRQMGDAIVQSPANPVQEVRHGDLGDLIGAFTRTAQAPAQPGGPSPLEAAFAQGGLLSSPAAKAGLLGLAAMIGSKYLRK